MSQNGMNNPKMMNPMMMNLNKMNPNMGPNNMMNPMNNPNLVNPYQMNPMMMNLNKMNPNMGPNNMMNPMNNPNLVNPYQMNPMMMNPMRMDPMKNPDLLAKMQQALNASDNNKQNNINNQLPQNNNINMVTDGSPDFTGMRIDGEYLREQEDNYSIDKILTEMKLNKEQFYIAVNARIRQLAIEVQTATRNFELQKQQNPNEQVVIVQKMEAVRDLSRIIKFYFKKESENDAKICRDYTNMDFDGLNGWIPAYKDSNGINHQGKLSFWDPISHSAIEITEDELANVEIPFLGHDNQCYNCWFNAFNSMISHIPSFYLYFMKLGESISQKSDLSKSNIKQQFPLSYEIAMYMKRVHDSKGSSKQYHETQEFVREIKKILPLSDGMNDVDDYKSNMMRELNEELGISVDKNLPDSNENINSKNGISVYNGSHSFGCRFSYSSPISKMFYTNSVSLQKCVNDNNHIVINNQITGDAFKLKNHKDKFGQNPKLSELLTHFNNNTRLTGNDRPYCNGCRCRLDTDRWDSAELFSSEATLTVISIQPQDNPNGPYSSNNPQQIKRPKKMPAFVKSGNNYFELISIGTHLHKGHYADGSFDHAHWVSYVKDVKNNQWHFCDDTHIDGKGNYSFWENKHQEFITNNINQILQNTSENGCNYVYKKCDKSKYDNAGNNIKEDISRLAFDKNGKGITKSPLYLISAKAKNYALQKDNPTNEDFKSAVESFKNRLQDQNVGILGQSGKIKQELIFGNQDLIINNDLNENIDNNVINNFNGNNMKNNYYGKDTSSAENTVGRRAVFIFSAIFAVAAIILGVVGAILTIKALTTAFIIAAILAVALFLAGCFYNPLRKAVESCLPGSGSGNSFENNLEKENCMNKFMSKNGTEYGDDPFYNPEINNDNPHYEQE
ncbi:MAG: hypothetical protein IJU86_01205 [Firmicutes bacterium]|nr:hypothetical protein [Bacillota bacterium]